MRRPVHSMTSVSLACRYIQNNVMQFNGVTWSHTKSRENHVHITCKSHANHVITKCNNELGAFPRLLKTEADKRLLKPLIDVYLQVCFLLKTPNGNKEYAVKLEEVSGSTNIQDGYEFGVPNVTVRI